MFKLKTISIVCILILSCLCYKVSDFKPSILRPSPPSGYHNVETGLSTQGQILCYGDLNGDQYNDYIAIADSKSYRLLIYFWDDVTSQFVMDTLSLQIYKNDILSIQQAMLNDLSADGTQQIIITYINNNNTYTTIVYKIFDCRSTSCSYVQVSGIFGNVSMSSMSAPPSLINIDSIPAFIVFDNSNRYIVHRNNQNTYIKSQFKQYLNQYKQNTYNTIDKHYTSNIDYDGDCHSDLVILSINANNKSVLQFYKKQTNSKYSIDNILQFKQHVLFYTLIDVDSSGTIDIFIVSGQPGKQGIYIIYNNADIPIDICKPNGGFPFSMSKLIHVLLPYPISGGGIVHLGDVNSDSYPDLLAIVTVNQFRKAVLLKNVQSPVGRAFTQTTQTNANLILQIKNPRQVGFFDLGQDGKLDIFVMVEQTKADKSTVVTRTSFLNNVKDDTLFIKILPLSQTAKYQKGSNRLSSAFGISMQWRITKLDGNKKISILNQKSQWNYGTLQLPYVIGGLGRTNNYIQDLTVGYDGIGQKMNWSPIIPDSKLLVYEKNDVWKLQTLLTNNERVNHVIYISVAILLVLGITIFILNYWQNKQDRRDQYNFIQLIR